MRVMVLTVLSLAIVGCGDYGGSGPSNFKNTYALGRIGTTPLPAPADGAGGTTLVVADTLRLLIDKAGNDQPFLRQVTVLQDAAGAITKSQNDYSYSVTGSFLTYDACPLGLFCAASLIYAPRTFQIAGDSLFEVIAQGNNRQPYVYGRISTR